jgi:hypothetical protein
VINVCSAEIKCINMNYDRLEAGAQVMLKIGNDKKFEWVDGEVIEYTRKGYNVKAYWGYVFLYCHPSRVKAKVAA